MRTRKTKLRDDRPYDTTSLHASGSGRVLSRDYSAHFFRWSFARRLIGKDDDVLEVGCGPEQPLSKLLVIGLEPKCRSYVGVDLNPLKASKIQRLTFHGAFNFVERHRELLKAQPRGFDKLVCFEVVEHMHSRFMKPFVQAALACLRPGGLLLLSTPVYDHVHHAANHINEMDVPTLRKHLERGGFVVERRFGTFMNIKEIGKGLEPPLAAAVLQVRDALTAYFDNDAISNIFGPLHPDHARNNLWLARKPKS